MEKEDEMNLRRYVYNLFSFPVGYFEKKTAEELKVSEAVRQKLIEMQNAKSEGISYQEQENLELQNFIKEFEEDWSK